MWQIIVSAAGCGLTLWFGWWQWRRRSAAERIRDAHEALALAMDLGTRELIDEFERNARDALLATCRVTLRTPRWAALVEAGLGIAAFVTGFFFVPGLKAPEHASHAEVELTQSLQFAIAVVAFAFLVAFVRQAVLLLVRAVEVAPLTTRELRQGFRKVGIWDAPVPTARRRRMLRRGEIPWGRRVTRVVKAKLLRR